MIVVAISFLKYHFKPRIERSLFLKNWALLISPKK